MGNFRFTSRIKQWTDEATGKLDLAVLDAATDIHRISALLTAKDTRALVNSGRIERVSPAHYKVIYGGGAVPYARRRHFENEKTPSSIGYLAVAGDSAARNFKRYLKGL